MPPPQLIGLSAKYIAQVCKVDLATARRWKRGTTCLPHTANLLLMRDLGCFHENWAGWTISERGELCSPEDWIVTPGDVRWIRMARAMLGDYRRENRKLKEIVEYLENGGFVEDQPLPSDWEYMAG